MKKRNNIIMVPSDFTKVADFAYDHAAGIAKILEAEIVVMHAIDKDTKVNLKKEKKGLQSLTDKLESVTKGIEKKYGVKAGHITREGDIFTTINEVADEIGARYIVMGTHGKTTFSQKTFRSFAIRVVTGSEVPFIIVQESGFTGGYKNILFPVSNQKEDKQKTTWVVQIAKTFNSTIHLFVEKTNDEFVDKQALNNAGQITTFLKKNDIKYVVKKSTEKGGKFCDQVEAYATKLDIDLIAIMTVQDQLLPNFVLGFWDEQILFNDDQIPVMCVNPKHTDSLHIGFNAV